MSKGEFVQILLEMFLTGEVVNPDQTPLEQTKEPFN
jgi:hypothetical protein